MDFKIPQLYFFLLAIHTKSQNILGKEFLVTLRNISDTCVLTNKFLPRKGEKESKEEE